MCTLQSYTLTGVYTIATGGYYTASRLLEESVQRAGKLGFTADGGSLARLAMMAYTRV